MYVLCQLMYTVFAITWMYNGTFVYWNNKYIYIVYIYIFVYSVNSKENVKTSCFPD